MENLNRNQVDTNRPTEKCRECFWREDCRDNIKQIFSNSNEDIDDIKKEFDEISECDYFLHNDYDSAFLGLSDVDLEQCIEVDKEEYKNDYDTYVREWN